MTYNQPPTSSKELREELEQEVRKYFYMTGYNDTVNTAVNTAVNRLETLITKATEALLESLPEPKDIPRPKDRTMYAGGNGPPLNSKTVHDLGYNQALSDVRTRLTTLRKEG